MFRGLIPFIEACVENIDRDKLPAEMNIVLDGGAFGGAYTLGSLLYLRELSKKGLIKIRKVSGTSIGAILGAFFVGEQLDSVSNEVLQKLLAFVKSNGTLEMAMEIVNDVFDWEAFQKHGGANDTLIISYTNMAHPTNNYVSSFDSREDLMSYLRRSIHLPWITTESCTVDGRFIDGISPKLIRDYDAPTLFISTMNLTYFGKSITSSGEVNFVPRIITGIDETHRFFTGTKRSGLCSYLHNWSILTLLIFRSRDILSLLVYLIFNVYTYVSGYLPDTITDSYAYCKAIDITSNIWRDVITKIIT
ncbi:MAG: hypothetical protein CL669_04255 [Balneola sp.]|nr:hypothetical protein [Balneola sp.]